MSSQQPTRTETPAQEVPPQMAMLQMISGFWISRLIYVAAKLGIPDLLHEGAKTANELAQTTGTHAPSLYRVLRALASVGVFSQEGRDAFALTPLSATLQTNTPGSIRWFAISELGEEHYPAWGDLADAYVLKWIIHDWDDERATTILRNCRNAITGDGKLLVIDVVIPRGSEPHFGKFMDLNMLVMTGGHERTEEEFRQLFATSGFNLSRVVGTESPFSIVEGVPA